MITGYLPSVMLTVLLLTVPPLMSTLAAVEGPVARSGRKISACRKVMFFIVWNVFFSNILSGSVLERFDTLSSLWDIPLQLANGVPSLVISLLINLINFLSLLALLVVFDICDFHNCFLSIYLTYRSRT